MLMAGTGVSSLLTVALSSLMPKAAISDASPLGAFLVTGLDPDAVAFFDAGAVLGFVLFGAVFDVGVDVPVEGFDALAFADSAVDRKIHSAEIKTVNK
jgi:hypothetical protein